MNQEIGKPEQDRKNVQRYYNSFYRGMQFALSHRNSFNTIMLCIYAEHTDRKGELVYDPMDLPFPDRDFDLRVIQRFCEDKNAFGPVVTDELDTSAFLTGATVGSLHTEVIRECAREHANKYAEYFDLDALMEDGETEDVAVAA